MMSRSILLVLLALCIGCGESLEPDQTAENIRLGREAAASAFQGLNEGNVQHYLDQIILAASFRPNHPQIEFHKARAFVLNGDTTSALSTLEGLAEMGVAMSLEDPVLGALRALEAGRSVEQRLIQNKNPVQTSRIVFKGNDPNLQPEGIARHQNRWLLASVHQNKIVWEDGSLFASTAPRSSMGMKISGASLWAANTSTPEGGSAPEEVGHSVLSEFDLATGALKASYSVSDSLSHWFGDLEIGPSGEVYVSDSNAPGVYVLKNGVLEPLVVGNPFSSPQGLAFSKGTLYVADYSAGIFAVDVVKKTAHLLKTPLNTSLLGIDGLYAYQSGQSETKLVAIQNGMIPPRVVTLELGNPRTITAVHTVDSNLPEYSDPTLGFVENDSLFYMANSQWPLFSPDASPADSLLRQAPIILGFPLM